MKALTFRSNFLSVFSAFPRFGLWFGTWLIEGFLAWFWEVFERLEVLGRHKAWELVGHTLEGLLVGVLLILLIK